ncbi:hypothetical protein KKF91_15405 [Myxococcota bacterium]|nr:hypothetical protein [Myxococcota bacterium]MBU1431927.1 hypothetical protein [Myxococcota bacterium]MBU1900437.1 hypothetical protein [Myxococcota bacterium]
MRTAWWFLLLALFAACGGPPETRLDKETIRRNADDADRDLDQESAKNQER